MKCTMDLDYAKSVLDLNEPYTVDQMVHVIRVFCTLPPILFKQELVRFPAAGGPHAPTRPYKRLQQADDPDMVSITVTNLTRKGAEAVDRLKQNRLDIITATILRDISNLWADLEDHYLDHPGLLPPERIAILRSFNTVTFACFVVIQDYANNRILMHREFRRPQTGREGDPNACTPRLASLRL